VPAGCCLAVGGLSLPDAYDSGARPLILSLDILNHHFYNLRNTKLRGAHETEFTTPKT
jgi:hypothetical protein